MYSVHQHWDKLKVCIVGKTYPQQFYSYISNTKVRNVLERIAIETEEDYQKLIKLLESFNVKVLRPEIQDSIEFYKKDKSYLPPPMTPRDYSAMIGTTLYWRNGKFLSNDFINVFNDVKKQQNKIKVNSPRINSAMTTRIGKDLYFGTETEKDYTDKKFLNSRIKEFSKNYRCHFVNTEGHSDSVFCPVVPGLIVSLKDIQNYEKTFPAWEIIYLPNEGREKIREFALLKEKNAGKWWVPGEELNDDFTEFVETWLHDWVGFVEETVFDVNMLVIDKNNVVCNNYNKKVFDAFSRYNITPHIVNFRHRYFWDGGLHCITSDLDREGVMEDYFPDRGNESIIS
ncbi:MAG: hypothetical protein RLZZ44_857 [Bacteroidota bacterium]|jgi:hypothetical protein